MKDLQNDIKKLADEEYIRASQKFGATNNSNHESYAVILEEHEEARDDGYKFSELLELFWYNVKNNNEADASADLRNMYDRAVRAAAEWVQVAAMCNKATLSIENTGESIKKIKPTVVFDFDGVIHSYISGWQGIHVATDPPTAGIREAIDDIRNDYRVVVVSTRCSNPLGLETVENYLAEHNIIVDEITANKPPAIIYIDDRAICFDGKPETLLSKIKAFTPWYADKNYIRKVGESE